MNPLVDSAQLSQALNLAQLFQKSLVNAGSLYQRPSLSNLLAGGAGYQIGVIGQLAISDDQPDVARCYFHVSPNILDQMPEVYCFEPWIRREIQWHIIQEGQLCWQYHRFWKSWMSLVASESDVHGTLAYAARWCLTAVRSLLHKHLMGFNLGLPEWQPSWSDWAHSEGAARRQYESFKKEVAVEFPQFKAYA